MGNSIYVIKLSKAMGGGYICAEGGSDLVLYVTNKGELDGWEDLEWWGELQERMKATPSIITPDFVLYDQINSLFNEWREINSLWGEAMEEDTHKKERDERKCEEEYQKVRGSMCL